MAVRLLRKRRAPTGWACRGCIWSACATGCSARLLCMPWRCCAFSLWGWSSGHTVRIFCRWWPCSAWSSLPVLFWRCSPGSWAAGSVHTTCIPRVVCWAIRMAAARWSRFSAPAGRWWFSCCCTPRRGFTLPASPSLPSGAMCGMTCPACGAAGASAAPSAASSAAKPASACCLSAMLSSTASWLPPVCAEPKPRQPA